MAQKRAKMAQKQAKNDKDLATLRAEIVELKRKNQEQAAIIRNQNEWIADLRADVLTFQGYFHRALDLLLTYTGGTPPPMEPPTVERGKIIKLQPNY
jgi:inhibitor of KinA sporulation pathway (predicted exonuclease)